MTLHGDVLNTVAAVDAVHAATEQEIVQELIARGYSRLRAEILAVFVPLGLGRAVIARLPGNPAIQLSETAVVCSSDDKRRLRLPLVAVREFETARHIGEENFTSGLIPTSVLSAVIGFSVEIQLINEALNHDKDLGGSRMAAPQLLRLADTPGFEDWCQNLAGVIAETKPDA